jgi:plasmid stabilization system protein ParE
MTEPRLTEQAEADLEELWAYIAANNPDAADRMVDAVLEGSRMYVRFPTWAKAATNCGRAFVALSCRPTSSFTGR